VSVTLTTTSPVWTLNLGDGENRFSPELIADVSAALTQVSESSEPVALQVTASGKFFSNGLDLEWLQANPNELQPYVTQVHEMLRRVLTLPVPTVCAINGHCFAAGAMLALACDYRVMHTGRGFFCLPEVDINIPFTPGMSALIQSKLSPRTALDTMTTGKRFDASAALDAGIVDRICTIEELADVAHSMVARLAGKDRGTLGAIKSTMFAPVVALLGSPAVIDEASRHRTRFPLDPS
jgi:Delta3-Delta2-enoyl-CoA isomerase